MLGDPARRVRRGGRRGGRAQGRREATAEELRDFVKEQVAAYKYPRRVWLVDDLPKGPTGQDPQARDRAARTRSERRRRIRVRPATPDDVRADLRRSSCELAEYERAPEQVTGTPEMLGEALFGQRPSAEAPDRRARRGAGRLRPVPRHASRPGSAGRGSGSRTSTSRDRHRRAGVGRALLGDLAAIAVRARLRRGWSGTRWTGTTPALGFYAEARRRAAVGVGAAPAAQARRWCGWPPADRERQ